MQYIGREVYPELDSGSLKGGAFEKKSNHKVAFLFYIGVLLR